MGVMSSASKLAVLGFDPGPRTGVALYLPAAKRVELMTAFAPESLLPALDDLLSLGLDAVLVVEDWENYGRRPGVSANLPNRVIGLLQGYAYAHRLSLHLHSPSRWKRSFSRNVSPISFKGLGQKDRIILARLAMECGDGVVEVARKVPKADLPHAVDAAGVAVYGAMVLGL